MKTFVLSLMAAASPVLAAEPKPAGKPKAEPTVKDMAAAEARKCDANYDGRISGSEVAVLRGRWPKNPKSWLYIFDGNNNKMLDDAEIATIEFKPASKPKPYHPKPVMKPAPKPPAKKK